MTIQHEAVCGTLQSNDCFVRVMPSEKIVENIEALLAETMRKKPADAKSDYVRSVSVSSTMGPGVWVDHKVGE